MLLTVTLPKVLAELPSTGDDSTSSFRRYSSAATYSLGVFLGSGTGPVAPKWVLRQCAPYFKKNLTIE